MSPAIEKAQRDIEAAQNRLAEIEQAEFSTIQTESATKARIASLRSQLPALLAARALGTDNGTDIAQIKKEISLAEETLRDTPFTMEGLKALKPPETQKLRNAQRLMEKMEKYESIKERLQKDYFPSLAGDLRDYAKILDLETDCENFLNQLPRHRS